jgi:hexosaminidase
MKQPNLFRELCAKRMIQHFFVAGIALAAAGIIMGCARLRPVEKSAQTPVATPTVIPRPVKLVLQAGYFKVGPATAVGVESGADDARGAAAFLSDWLTKATGGAHPVNTFVDEELPHGITFMKRGAKPEWGEEGYGLEITSKQVLIRANSAAGFFYGVQTLRQLLPPEAETVAESRKTREWSAPCVAIEDMPRFGWRGLMLDSSRHFQEKEFIEHLLDVMAYHKLNRFHWHLIDANGWRLEIKRYPELAKKGSWRGTDARSDSGWYTQEDVREIVAYAKHLHIMVIPEIEMPAHTESALFVFPQLTCTGKAIEVGEPGLDYFTKNDSNLSYCAGKEATFEFLENVLTEVTQLFDAPFIHVGGDERPNGSWEQCPDCQARMKAVGAKDEHDLQNYFMRRITDFLATKHRRVISWAVTRSDSYNPKDLDDLGHDSIIQSWHEETRFALSKGWDVINSANRFVYLDYPEFSVVGKPAWMPLLPLEKVYQFEPVPKEVSGDEAKLIWGGEACLWTEAVPQEKIYGALFPRLLALAEVTWSPAAGKNYEDFAARVKLHAAWLKGMGVEYGRPPGEAAK